MTTNVHEARDIKELKSGTSWLGPTITYSFLSSLPSYYDGFAAINSTTFSSEPFSDTQKDQIRYLLTQIENLTGLEFNEIQQVGSVVGDITFGFTDLPVGVAGAVPSYYDPLLKGDVWISSTAAGRPGELSENVLLHEIMHALGFKHPVNYGGFFSQDPGPFFESDEDPTEQFTVLSYRPNPNGWGLSGLQLYDIAVLQSVYGANRSFNNGEDTYSEQVGEQYSIWDADGIDTLSAAGISKNATIDLREGYFSTITNLDGFDNISIAFGAEIENAVGSGQDDVIVGNSLNNDLRGKEGDDFLFADEAALLIASDGDDPSGVYFTSEAGAYAIEDQNDASTSSNVLIGGEGSDELYGSSGSDFLFGGNQSTSGREFTTDSDGNIQINEFPLYQPPDPPTSDPREGRFRFDERSWDDGAADHLKGGLGVDHYFVGASGSSVDMSTNVVADAYDNPDNWDTDNRDNFNQSIYDSIDVIYDSDGQGTIWFTNDFVDWHFDNLGGGSVYNKGQLELIIHFMAGLYIHCTWKKKKAFIFGITF